MQARLLARSFVAAGHQVRLMAPLLEAGKSRIDTVDGITETVGRAHARLRFDAATGDYRLFDEGSSNGTSVVRDGDVIVVHRRDPRGVRVRSGDEIQVGRALLRITIGD